MTLGINPRFPPRSHTSHAHFPSSLYCHASLRQASLYCCALAAALRCCHLHAHICVAEEAMCSLRTYRIAGETAGLADEVLCEPHGRGAGQAPHILHAKGEKEEMCVFCFQVFIVDELLYEPHGGGAGQAPHTLHIMHAGAEAQVLCELHEGWAGQAPYILYAMHTGHARFEVEMIKVLLLDAGSMPLKGYLFGSLRMSIEQLAKEHHTHMQMRAPVHPLPSTAMQA
eukprot:171089-Pelagomonas_calceolata.AAC.3